MPPSPLSCSSWRWLLVLLLLVVPLRAQSPAANGAAAGAPPTTLAELAQHRNLWPAQVTLKADVRMVILSNGREAGAIVSPAGTSVDLVAVTPAGLQVQVMQATATVPAEQTDLWALVGAAGKASSVAATSAAPPPAAATHLSPVPVAPPAPAPRPGAPASAYAVSGPPLKFDCEIPPRDNFDKAAFRFWSPAYQDPIRGIIVLVPGADGDGRGMTGDGAWQALAQKYRLALIGVNFQSRGHAYSDAANGSGDALLEAIKHFSEQANRPEVAAAPIALYGESAGGQFNYDFAMWKPERVICFVVNKGAYYVDGGSSPPARAVPGLFFLGLSDTAERIAAINGIWTEGREHGALWALARQPHSGHEFSRTAALARAFFDPVFRARLPDDSLGSDPSPLNALDETKGWLGDLTTFEIHDASGDTDPDRKAAWFPDQASAMAWKAFVSK